MAFDINKTVALIKGGLLDHAATWSSYLGENPTWQQTATVLAGPLILANVILAAIFARMIGGYFAYGGQVSLIGGILTGLVVAVLVFVLAVVVINFLAGVFQGKPDFSRAFAACALAWIPAWVAGVVGALIPFIGLLVALAGSVVSLVFLYRILPLALAIPQEKRVIHFVVSIVAIIVCNMVVMTVLGVGAMTSAAQMGG